MSCRHAIGEVSGEAIAGPWWRRWLTRAHLWFCPACRVYDRQIEQTAEAVSRLEPEPPPDALCDRILQELRAKKPPSEGL